MSAYTTQAAIEGEIAPSDLIALTDDDGTGSINTTVLNQIIANASGVIDQKVSNIYTTPFNPVPSAVASMALTIACYKLYRRRLVPDEKNNFAEDYSGVVEFLNQVNEGEKHIDQTPPRTFPQGAVNARPTVYGGSIFSNGVATSM